MRAQALGIQESVQELALELNRRFVADALANNLGAAQSRRNLPGSVESFQKASQGDPNDPAYLFNLGYALWKGAQYDEAAEKFRAALDRAPEDPLAILMLGRCLNRTPAKETDLKTSISFDFEGGLLLEGDAAEKFIDKLTRFASAAAYVEATAEVN